MLTTVEEVKNELGFLDDSQNPKIKRIIKSVSQAIKTYCNRDFSEYTLDENDPEKERLPYDVEDACVLWSTYRYGLGNSIGVSSERVDGLGQKNYTLQHVEGKFIAAPPAVLTLLNPYRKIVIS